MTTRCGARSQTCALIRAYLVTAVPLREEAGTHVLPARVGGDEPFNVLGVWTKTDPTYVRALLKGLDTYRDFIVEGPTVVVGDFNSSTVFDHKDRKANHTSLVRRLADEFGLVSAYHAFLDEEHGSETRPTLYWQFKRSQPFHIDYCFVPEDWAGRIANVEVGTFEDQEGVSDHRPLIVDFRPKP
jgi:exodeoxyribonuclease-3